MARVLLLEDHSDWRARLADILRREDHVVVVAKTRDEALARIAALPHVDVAVVDLYIDGSIAGGDEICREAKELAIPVIVVSGPATRSQVASLFSQYKIAAFIEKVPFDEPLFRHSINKVLKLGTNKAQGIAEDEIMIPQQINNVIYMIDSKIQNLAQAGHESSLTVTGGSSAQTEVIRRIAKGIDEMVQVVKTSTDLSPDAKKDYELESIGLKNELSKSRLNLSRIRDMLAFLGDAEGTVGLATRVTPYIAMIAPLVEQLLKYSQ